MQKSQGSAADWRWSEGQSSQFRQTSKELMKLNVYIPGSTETSQREFAKFAAKIRVRSQCLKKTNWCLKVV